MMRIVSTGNLKKITSSMKMVSSAKMQVRPPPPSWSTARRATTAAAIDGGPLDPHNPNTGARGRAALRPPTRPPHAPSLTPTRTAPHRTAPHRTRSSQADLKRLAAVAPFNEFAKTLCGPATMCEDLDVSTWPEKNLVVAVSSDKGLCGGVNSFIARNMKKINAKLASEGKSMKVVVWGEKGRSQVTNARRDARTHEKNAQS